MKIAITGHTSGLGKSFYDESICRGHTVHGFSRTNGYDLRDYSKVSLMLDKIVGFDLFINNAKPDYAQSQILYRIARSWKEGTVVSIGSQAVITPPNWTDTYLLEYLTQKTALMHTYTVLSPVVECKLVLLNPAHLDDNTLPYAQQELTRLGV
jgi:hypothetical protein